MEKLTKYSVQHPVSILMYILLICIAGIISLFAIKMDYLPYISDRTILVSTVYDGLPASEMKELITIPEEDTFSSLKGIKNISSVTRDSMSFIKIEFQYKTNINNALLETRQIIDQLYQRLPQKAQKPKAEIFSTNKNYLLTIAVIPPKEKLSQSRHLIEKQIKHDLQKIKGCGKIEITGGLKDQITIEADLNLINSKNITLDQIAEAIENTNYEYPAGTIKNKENEYILKTSNLFKTSEDILQTQINLENDIISLNEIANVKKDFMTKESFCTFNDKECIQIEISKKTDESPVTLSSNIRNYISKLNSKYPDYTFTIIDDTSIEIKNNIILIYLSAFLGTIISFSLLLIFFKNIRLSILISSVIPICILFSISILFLFGKNLNLFSLSGISISLGMIIDPASILIQKLIQTKRSDSKLSSDEIIIKSSQNIQKSNLGSTMTTIIVFIPFFLLPGIFGELFSDLSIAIISSILFSYILSLTYIPAMSKIFLINTLSNINQPQFLETLKISYSKYIKNNISNTKLIKLISIATTLILVSTSILIKKEIIPVTNNSNLNFSIEYPTNYSLNKIQNETEILVYDLLLKYPNSIIYTKGGIDSENYYKLSDYSNTTNTVFYSIKKITSREKNEILQKLKTDNINISLENKQDILSRALNIKTTYLIQNTSAKTLLSQNTKPSYKTNEITFIPDTNKCNYYHIPKDYLSYYCYQALNGLNAGEFIQNGTYIPIKVKSKKTDTTNINIPYKDLLVPLSALGTYSINETEKILFRYNKKDSKETDIKPENISDENILKLSQEHFSELIKNGTLLIFIVLILIYCFLGAQFDSFALPLILLITVIPASSGALLFLFIFNQSINIYSILSLVVLFGTCVNNSIIFYEAILLSEKNKSINEICSNELNSIFITTITSISALIPFTLDPLHINSQTSISIALCGGLGFCMLITIIIYPFIFSKLRIKIHEQYTY